MIEECATHGMHPARIVTINSITGFSFTLFIVSFFSFFSFTILLFDSIFKSINLQICILYDYISVKKFKWYLKTLYILQLCHHLFINTSFEIKYYYTYSYNQELDKHSALKTILPHDQHAYHGYRLNKN